MADPACAHRIVDAHIHVWTDDYERYPLAAGALIRDHAGFLSHAEKGDIPWGTAQRFFSRNPT